MNIIDKLNQHFALNAEVKDGIISGSGSNADEIKILSMPLYKDRLFVRELLKGTDFCCLTEYILTGTDPKFNVAHIKVGTKQMTVIMPVVVMTMTMTMTMDATRHFVGLIAKHLIVIETCSSISE